MGLLTAGGMATAGTSSFLAPRQIARTTRATTPLHVPAERAGHGSMLSSVSLPMHVMAAASTFAAAFTFSNHRSKAQTAVAVATIDEVAAATIDEGAATSTDRAEAVQPPFDPAAQLGAIPPLGFFDPLGFTKIGDEAGFRHLRASELKHGRVAMIASIGALGEHFIKLPWAEGVHGTFGAITSGEGYLLSVPLFVASGMLEMQWRDDPEKRPGNFGNPFGVEMDTPDMRTKELSNGRMAMMSMLGVFVAELLTGKDAVEQLGF